ncbi:hypothetical protein [Lacunimicrobium album]
MNIAEHTDSMLVVDRRSPRLRYDRRNRAERRKDVEPVVEVAVEKRVTSSSERRNKVERRRQIDPTTCERDYSNEEIDFMKAIDDYKRRSGRQFPTWSEVLEVIRDLGYRKTAEPSQTYHQAQAQSA